MSFNVLLYVLSGGFYDYVNDINGKGEVKVFNMVLEVNYFS